jgi:hypothetical protein
MSNFDAPVSNTATGAFRVSSRVILLLGIELVQWSYFFSKASEALLMQ